MSYMACLELTGVLCLCIACALRCFTCTATDPKSCTDTKSCPVIFNRCFSLRVDGKFFLALYWELISLQTASAICWCSESWVAIIHTSVCSVQCFLKVFPMCFLGYDVVTKGCQTSIACIGAMACCEGDLCNSAVPAASSAILLLVSSAIIALVLSGWRIQLFLWCTLFWPNLYN